jgi:hypothetical protein
MNKFNYFSVLLLNVVLDSLIRGMLFSLIWNFCITPIDGRIPSIDVIGSVGIFLILSLFNYFKNLGRIEQLAFIVDTKLASLSNDIRILHGMITNKSDKDNHDKTGT